VVQHGDRGSVSDLMEDLLTFNRLLAGPVVHLVYWAGLSVIVLGAFGVIGGAVGVAVKEPGLQSILLAIPMLVVGLLVVGAMGLLWRSFCEFYVLMIKIGEDLSALRKAAESATGKSD
jgi:hypothetical protein